MTLATLAIKLLIGGLSFALCTQALRPNGRPYALAAIRPSLPKITATNVTVKSVSGTRLPPLDTVYYFDQLIDHNNPKMGTFQQRYWHTWQYYKQGGPIILTTPGESNAEGYTGYLTTDTINGMIAQQEGGATVVLEHRFFGKSNPLGALTVDNLRLLTIQQAIDDFEYFAKNVKLAMPGGNNVKPSTTPWVLTGGSYSGALVSWTMTSKPGLFKAGYASSAAVQAITDFWGYFEPIRQYMPQNCSADVEAVITHVDQVLTTGSASDISALKANFGLQDLTHDDDLAGALRQNIWTWQYLQPSSGKGGIFYHFCDALEVVNRTMIATAAGWGLQHALQAWGNYWNQTYLYENCDQPTIDDCFGTYNSSQPTYTVTDVNNAERSWKWLVCNEVGWYQESAPTSQATLVSRVLQPAHDAKQCDYYFPGAFGTNAAPSPNVDQVNQNYGGWNVNISGIFFANGLKDPWREATVSASGSTFSSTSTQLVAVSDGHHCSDLDATNARADATVAAVQKQGLAAIKTWLSSTAPPKHNHERENEFPVKQRIL